LTTISTDALTGTFARSYDLTSGILARIIFRAYLLVNELTAIPT
jgi:hypothetical protein